jgi:hypothetical protein
MTAAKKRDLPAERPSERATKVAVSLPAEVSTQADAYAARIGVSRSELVARALRAYLRREEAASITAQLDAVYGPAGAPPDAEIARLSAATRGRLRRAIDRGAW